MPPIKIDILFDMMLLSFLSFSFFFILILVIVIYVLFLNLQIVRAFLKNKSTLLFSLLFK